MIKLDGEYAGVSTQSLCGGSRSNVTVICPFCSQTTEDLDFCDHCNQEIGRPAKQETYSSHSVQLSDGEFLDLSSWGGAWPSDPTSCLTTANLRRHYGFAPTLWNVHRESILRRAAIRLNCLPLIEVVEFEDGAVVVSEPFDRDCCDAPQYHNSPRDLADLCGLVSDCENFAGVMTELHEAGFVWLNFRPDALVRTSTGLKITSLYFWRRPLRRNLHTGWAFPDCK